MLSCAWELACSHDVYTFYSKGYNLGLLFFLFKKISKVAGLGSVWAVDFTECVEGI